MSKSDQTPAPYQMSLDLGVEVEKTVEGMEMGVLQNGIPYLTQRDLATMSGAARATIFEVTQEWEQSFGDPIPAKGRMANGEWRSLRTTCSKMATTSHDCLLKYNKMVRRTMSTRIWCAWRFLNTLRLKPREQTKRL